jgi:hypothetical protein
MSQFNCLSNEILPKLRLSQIIEDFSMVYLPENGIILPEKDGFMVNSDIRVPKK